MKKLGTPELDLSFLNNFALEDDIYLRIDKLQALCAAQTLLDGCNMSMPSLRLHYSLVIEEQVTELRNLIDKLFA